MPRFGTPRFQMGMMVTVASGPKMEKRSAGICACQLPDVFFLNPLTVVAKWGKFCSEQGFIPFFQGELYHKP